MNTYEYYKKNEVVTFQMKKRYLTLLSPQLHAFQQEGRMCDVHLITGKDMIKAHRIVLAARTSYFDELFTEEFTDSWHMLVDVSQIIKKKASLEEILNFFYTGEITITLNTLEDILNASFVFKLRPLTKCCTQYMMMNLTPMNCVDFWILANRFNLQRVVLSSLSV